MKKDKEWLKEAVWKQDTVMSKGYIYTDDLMSIINELDEPEQTDIGVGLSKPVIPQFVVDFIEAQDDPIYEMCVSYEMWGVNGNDGTTSFTGEIAEWFDDSLNVKKYYRACLGGYEVEKEPQWVVRYEDGYFSEEIKFGCGIDGDWVDEVSRAYHFTDKAKAEAVALLIGGTVEEVTE